MLTLKHGNDKGTGSRLDVEMVPMTEYGGGYVSLEITPQSGVCAGEYLFDEPHGIELRLNAWNVGKMLWVLGGKGPSLDRCGGVRIKSGNDIAVLHLDKDDEGKGYQLHVTRGSDVLKRHWRLTINESEATTIRTALSGALTRIAFAE